MKPVEDYAPKAVVVLCLLQLGIWIGLGVLLRFC